MSDFFDELFKTQYFESEASRNPLSDDFLGNLEDILTRLGYQKLISKNVRNIPFTTYVRPRRDSTKLEVFNVKNGAKGEDYFEHFVVKSEGKAKELAKPFERDDDWYDLGHFIGKAAVTVGCIATGAYIGYNGDVRENERIGDSILGGFLGLLGGGVQWLITYGACNENAAEEYSTPRFDKDSSYAWSLLVLPYAHATGKFTNQVVNGIRKAAHYIGKGELSLNDWGQLANALTHSPRYTYE